MVACACGGTLEMSMWLILAIWTGAGSTVGIACVWLKGKIGRKSCRP